jgi:hypothetical protein
MERGEMEIDSDWTRDLFLYNTCLSEEKKKEEKEEVKVKTKIEKRMTTGPMQYAI